MDIEELKTLLRKDMTFPLSDNVVSLLENETEIKIKIFKNKNLEDLISLCSVEEYFRRKHGNYAPYHVTQGLEAERDAGNQSVDVILVTDSRIVFDIFVSNTTVPYSRIVAIAGRHAPIVILPSNT